MNQSFDPDGHSSYRPPAESSGKAIAALVLGLLSPFCSVFTAIPAFILGILALSDISKEPGRLSGRGMAICGLICAAGGMVLQLLMMAALLLPAIQAAREAARRNVSTNRLHEIGIAMQMHHDANRSFPAPAIYDADGKKPLLSWRVKILPYLEEAALYESFHLDEPWDSAHNKTLISRMPSTYADPNDPELERLGKTRYLLPTGPAALFQGKTAPSIRSISDGTANTLMIVEVAADRAVIWTKPDDLEIDPQNPHNGLQRSRPRGFLAGFSDGSVRFIDDDEDAETLRRLFDPHDGKAVEPFKY